MFPEEPHGNNEIIREIPIEIETVREVVVEKIVEVPREVTVVKEVEVVKEK